MFVALLGLNAQNGNLVIHRALLLDYGTGAGKIPSKQLPQK
jgi:hypothetical protein